ncbi:hypothetical protein AOLI_G00159930 [Acnodon oligacanthus]
MRGHDIPNRSETPVIRALRSGRNTHFSSDVTAEGTAYLCVTAAPSNPPGNRSSSDFTPLSRLIQTPQPPFRRATSGSSALTASGARCAPLSSAPFTQRRRGCGTLSETTDFMSAYSDYNSVARSLSVPCRYAGRLKRITGSSGPVL